MKTNFLSLLKSEFAKNSLTLISGSVVGQGIALLIYPLLTRLFSQSDLGAYATWLSVVDVLTILSTGKYEDAVMLGRDKSAAAATARLAMRVNTVFSLAAVAVAAVVFVCGKADFTVFLIPPMIFFCGTSRVYKALFNYAKAFGQMAFSNIANSVAAALTKLTGGFARITTGALPAGSLVGQMVGNINYRLRLKSLQFPRTSWAEARDMAIQHRNFPLFSLPKSFVNSLSHNLPFIFLAYYFDNARLGLFSLALTCTYVPLSFFSAAFHNVLYKKFSEKYLLRQTLKTDIRNFISATVVIFIPVFVLGGVFAKSLLAFIFGNVWEGAALYVHTVLPWIFANLLLVSLGFLPDMFSKQRTDMFFNIAMCLLRLAALVAGVVCHNFDLAIELFAAVSALMSLAMLGWYLVLVRRYEHSLA